MPRISTYDKDHTITTDDKMVGSDGTTGTTFNYTAGDLANFVREDTTYVHTQAQSGSVWAIEHNLNRFPSIEVVDSAGSVVVGDIQYIDENNITINFSAPFTGKAYLN